MQQQSGDFNACVGQELSKEINKTQIKRVNKSNLFS